MSVPGWFRFIQEKLHVPWLAPSSDTVPFGLTGVPAVDWQADGLGQESGSHWTLTAHTAAGLEARWEMVHYEDTRAIECWGSVINRGRDPARGIQESLTLDFNLQLPWSFGQPWVRSVNGVRFCPSHFPPHDFGVVDRQLLRMRQVWTPLTLANLPDGRSSSENLPCAILCSEDRTMGFSLFLEWSGLWRMAFQQDPAEFGQRKELSAIKVTAGLWGLSLDLRPGMSLPLPRVLVTFFDGDLEAGGNSVRRHIRRHVTPKLGGEPPLPPTSFNHWFTFGSNFTTALLRPIVSASAAAGLEYFVVDAGWFEGGFRKGVGNWDTEDSSKFPEGVAAFSRYVRSAGMKYGTWFEPEWAHEHSDLYRRHPHWFWPSPQRTAFLAPSIDPCFFNPTYHLLNLGLPEARAWVLNRIIRAYEQWGMKWVRWDFNQMPRPNWEHGAAEGEIGLRQIEHVTGLYRVLDDILKACPDLLIEQCAGGGHRIDLGTVRRGHTFWMNDHTSDSDLVRTFQHGLNTVLPGNYANTNLCQNRHDYTDYDFYSHACGGFGYSGKLHEAPASDAARLAAAIGQFKEHRRILLGDYHRPTGQPRSIDDYVKVMFSDGADSLALEFNLGGRRRSASRSLGRHDPSAHASR